MSDRARDKAEHEAPDPARPVDRCVCHNVTFAELKRMSEEGGAGFETLKAWTGCGDGCGMCEPYVRKMLETGEVQFAVLTIEKT